MNSVRVLLVALIAACAAAGAVAQWKWRDRNGVVQYSDVPPPNGTPEKDILERPKGVQRRLQAAEAASAASAPAAASGPSAKGPLDPELEARRRKAEIERAEATTKETAARRAEEERVAAVRADNCQRARSALRTLEEGVRVTRTNPQGEREVLDDKGRAEEMARARSTIGSDCR